MALSKNIFTPIFFCRWDFLGSCRKTSLCLLARPHDAPKGSNCKEAPHALEWLTAQSVTLAEQMGEEIKHLNKLSAHLCCESKLRTWMNQFTANAKKILFLATFIFQVADVCVFYIYTHSYRLYYLWEFCTF